MLLLELLDLGTGNIDQNYMHLIHAFIFSTLKYIEQISINKDQETLINRMIIQDLDTQTKNASI